MTEIKAKFFEAVIGSNLKDEAIQNLFQKMGEKPNIEPDDEVLFYEFKKNGVSFLFDETKILTAIHIFGENKDQFLAYTSELPEQISFKNSKAEILEKLGKPSLQGGGEPSLLGGKVPPWIKYLFPHYQLHLQFDESLKKIALVTLMSPDKHS